MVLVAPSLLAADFSHLAKDIKVVEMAGADWLHLDVMDGHFVSNLSFGADVIKQIRPLSKLFFDAHLMVEDPLKFLPQFLDSGANQITVHFEACQNLSLVLDTIKKHGLKVGISIKPMTPAHALKPFIDMVDTVLIMTVEPGFGGQKFKTDLLPKIADVAKLIEHHSINLEVDGGINPETAKLCVERGANVLVAGSAIFKNSNPAKIINLLRNKGE